MKWVSSTGRIAGKATLYQESTALPMRVGLVRAARWDKGYTSPVAPVKGYPEEAGKS